MVMTNLGLWIFFVAIIATALAVDLGLKSHRDRTEAIALGEAARWTILWVGLAFLFAGVVYAVKGHVRALEFMTGYLVEESLSVDNMFVFILIFHYFKVPPSGQPRILKWGILGAVLMRFILIFTGVSLLEHFHWVMYLFGGFLIVTAVKLAREKDETINLGDNKVLKLFQRLGPVTPFLATLLVVETSDLVFATDSIPAVLAISKDPFIVFSSNVFAVLGLRSLFFLVSGYLELFRFLRYGLSIVLIFIGGKMLLSGLYPIPIAVSLTVVAGVLAASVLLSVLWKNKKN
jgi:tellurite resistance protein TerC